jgi:transcriptional regulator with GAF, ATPase, and Fis domain
MVWLALALIAGVAIGFAIARLAARRALVAARRVPASPDDTSAEIENLRASNALLRTLGSSPDITQSLFDLAQRIRAIVPCDRVGLALLTEDREGYNTSTVRLDEGRSAEATVHLHFPRRSALVDEVVTAREGRIVDDVGELAPTYLDANVIKSAGFSSLILVPLIFGGEPLGTLNVAARRRGAFSQADLHRLNPVAEALAASFGTRRLATALARHQTANELSELTFAFANDMSSAVQAIVGQCELLAREWRDPSLERELVALQHQARRLGDILNNMQRMTREHAATKGT